MPAPATALKISAETAIDPRTVQRAYRGEWVVPALYAMITATARALGLDPPPANPDRRPRKPAGSVP